MIETNRIEFKEKLTDNLEKEIVAFLNYGEGGFLYIGINNNGNTVGLNNIDEIQLKIKDRLKFNIEPSCLGLFDIVVEKKDNRNIIKIIVASGTEKPYYLKKQGMSSRGCFIHKGSASERMLTQMINLLFSCRTRNSIGKIKSHNQDLIKILNRGDATIKEHLANLKKEGVLKRVGSTKSGYWEVNK